MESSPQKVTQVPNEKPQPREAVWTPLSLKDKLDGAFTSEEAAMFEAMHRAATQEDLNDAIAAFNANATGKKASEHGMSLEDMHVDDEPLQLASGFAVRVSRSKSGVTQFRNPAA
jgi:hypothetical protein